MNDSERSLDAVTRAASAMGRGRPVLSKAWSVSSPNMTNMTNMDMEVDILERIRDLEGQISAQQVKIMCYNILDLVFIVPGDYSVSAGSDLRVWISEGHRVRESELRHFLLRRGPGQHGQPVSQHQHQRGHGWELNRSNYIKDSAVMCMYIANILHMYMMYISIISI